LPEKWAAVMGSRELIAPFCASNDAMVLDTSNPKTALRLN
jgi:hypothetical protein